MRFIYNVNRMLISVSGISKQCPVIKCYQLKGGEKSLEYNRKWSSRQEVSGQLNVGNNGQKNLIASEIFSRSKISWRDCSQSVAWSCVQGVEVLYCAVQQPLGTVAIEHNMWLVDCCCCQEVASSRPTLCDPIHSSHQAPRP